VLLKAALLFGARAEYGVQLAAVQAPSSAPSAGPRPVWNAWIVPRPPKAAKTGAEAAVEFKPNKTGDYTSTTANNGLALSDLDVSFALTANNEPPTSPAGAARAVPFEALIVAEGEWSQTCKRLGVTKTVDRFATAIGLVANLEVTKGQPRSKSFVQNALGENVRGLVNEGISTENLEYLRGETHYVAATIHKPSLLKLGVLKEDKAGKELLAPANIDVDALMKLGRRLATACGIPENTPFCDFHPVQLFDFSTRARALTPWRVLSLRADGKGIRALDREAHPTLRDANTRWHEREAESLRDLLREKQAAKEAAAKQVAAFKEAWAKKAEDLLNEAGEPLSEQEKQGHLDYLKVLEEQAAAQVVTAQGKLDARLDQRKEWMTQQEGADQVTEAVPVFPVGDALLEPFWPQGLGSNRGFHTALDAVWAMRVLATDGLMPALLERGICYDVVVGAGAFATNNVQAGANWTADPVHRYHGDLFKMVIRTYQDPKTKRQFKGKDAIPARYIGMKL